MKRGWEGGAHSSAGQWEASLVLLHRVHHSQLHCQLSLGVRDDGVGEVPTLTTVGLRKEVRVCSDGNGKVVLLIHYSTIYCITAHNEILLLSTTMIHLSTF